MVIRITVSDDKVLKAVKQGMIKNGYPKNDVLEDATLIDENDVAQYLIKGIDVDAEDITIDRD